jgi:hypothetical protein
MKNLFLKVCVCTGWQRQKDDAGQSSDEIKHLRGHIGTVYDVA